MEKSLWGCRSRICPPKMRLCWWRLCQATRSLAVWRDPPVSPGCLIPSASSAPESSLSFPLL